ncbi:hypothetical protein FRC17_002859, partial [Serendipita sp. 399]
MSHRTFSPYSTPARQPAGWPVYAQSPSQKHAKPPTNTNIGSNLRSFQTPRLNTQPVLKVAEHKAPVPVNPPVVQQVWIPPDKSDSPVDFPWPAPFFLEGDSTSTDSTSSSDDDESPAETSVPLAPKPTLSSAKPQDKKPLDGSLFGSSPAIFNLSNILTPMANHRGGMQLLAYRSPSVRVDKDTHGAFSPATTVHIVLPYSPSARPASKPPLPLPTPSAKAVPRPQRTTLQPQPATTNSILSPPVIGLDLALLPPTDHRDSAMSLRNSINVLKAGSGRPTPIDVPSRVSTITNGSARHIWKPSSAPTPPSPIAAGPPESAMPLTRLVREDVPPPLPPKDNSKLNTPDLSHRTASVSSSDSAETPAPKPSPVKVPTPVLNDRAEIIRRTLSSTNLHQASKSGTANPTPERGPTPVMQIPEIVVEGPAPTDVEALLQMITRPGPLPLQSTIMFPLDDPDFDEPPAPAPLRVVNVTNDIGMDSMATVPTTIATQEIVIDVNPSSTSLDTPVSTASTDSSSTLSVPTEPPSSSNLALPATAEQTAGVEEAPRASEPKHRSLPAVSRSLSGHSGPSTLYLPRISLTDRPVPGTSNPSSLPPRGPPKLPPPNYKSWHPRRPTVPTPLSQTPMQANTHLPQAPMRQWPSRKPQPPVQQPFPRYTHSHSRSDPPLSALSGSLTRVDQGFEQDLEPPQPAFAAPDYYSSDDDDPSKWAPYPEA